MKDAEWFVRQVSAADAALDAAGVPSDGKSLAERIEMLAARQSVGDIEPQAGGLGMTIEEAVERYGLDDPAKRSAFNEYPRQAPRITLTPHSGAFVASFREEHGIQRRQLATALGLTVNAIKMLEAGQKTTDAAGWAEIQTALFILASKPAELRGIEAEHIADPMSDPRFQELLSDDDEPQTWTRDIGPLDT